SDGCVESGDFGELNATCRLHPEPVRDSLYGVHFTICGDADDLVCPNGQTVPPSAGYLKTGMPDHPQVTKGPMLLVGPDFVGYPHSDDAPWARRHPPSMAGGGSRGIHAARPTPRRLRLACT